MHFGIVFARVSGMRKILATLAMLTPLLGCDGSNTNTTCPASMLEAMHSNPCNLAEGTECTYDCGGCGGPQISVCKGGRWETTWWCECAPDSGPHDMTVDTVSPDASTDLCCNPQGQIVPCFCPDAGIPCQDTRDFVECPAPGTCVPTGQACPGDAGAGDL
jgi:hypothetical protein